MILEDLLSLDAGNRLDAGIEHLSFGYGVKEIDGQWHVRDGMGGWILPRPFSTDSGLSTTLISLVTALAGCEAYHTVDQSDGCRAEIVGVTSYSAAANTVPLAACRAVLEATNNRADLIAAVPRHKLAYLMDRKA